MGQHKYNQTAIDAAAGLIPPKPKKPGKAELRRAAMEAFMKARTEADLNKDEIATDPAPADTVAEN